MTDTPTRRAASILLLLGALALLGPQALGAQAGHLFTTIPAVEMVHSDLGGTVIDQTFSRGGWSAYCTGFCELVADARLPHGARVVGIEIDACRDATGDRPINFFLVRRQPNDSGELVRIQTLLQGTVNTTGCSYRTAVAPAEILVDNFNGEYLVAATIGDLLCGIAGQPPCPDSGSRFQAMRVYYEPNSAGGVVQPSQRSSFSPLPPP